MAFKLRKTASNRQEKSTKTSISLYLSFYNLGIVKSIAKGIQGKLLKAGISEDPQLYAAKLFFFLLLSIVMAVFLTAIGIFIFVKFYLLFRLAKYLVLSMMMIMFGIIIPPTAYLAITANISQTIENRRIGYDAEVAPFSSVFIIFLKAGLAPRIMFEKLSKSSAFNFVTQYSTYLTKRMRYLGEGVEDAIANSVKTSPSKLLTDFLMTYVTAVRTGAPVIETMESKAKDILEQLKLKASLASDKLSGIAEVYVIWLSSGFIMFFLTIILQGVFPQLHFIPDSILGVLAVVVLPLINLIFVYEVEQIQLRFPDKKVNYRIFYISFASGIVVMLAILAAEHQLVEFFTLSGGLADVIPVSVAITIGLLVASLPPAIILTRKLRAGTGYDPYVVGFLRAISEGVRAGLPPETVIRNIKDAAEMGKLRTILQEIYGYMRLGYPLKDAFKKGSEKIMDFSSKIALVSLADMIEIGSMTPETVESIADQIDAQIKIKREYDEKVKILLATPYVGIVLALIASLILGSAILGLISGNSALTFSYGPLASASVYLPKAIFITAISSIFNSFFAGFLVGKLSSGKIAYGFLHSAILVAITLVMLIVLVHVHFNFMSSSPASL
ncbi:flagellar assembly protein [Candidatus Acidianus copahuensis]|uniref:Flagellar assembly protein n=1 Tax=Candidatus Acidianus copahuensis TaxID=1160895 RepID=A0A031LQZ2_9CREN|nr:type II secretion system F family protein [Candidatus Acidianus copahuensis]EZQ10802.1 flagellar assembly protein [Candidatus Acidianus copahuensis]